MDNSLTFTDRKAFREWLGKYGRKSDGIWLRFSKKGKFVTLSAGEALEEALCHGWIDGRIQSVETRPIESILRDDYLRANGPSKTSSWHRLLWKWG
jgi:uncharacterized protein YdeI (YjbR/CyaY-like superfamily)